MPPRSGVNLSGPAKGAGSGAIWVVVVGVSQFLLGLGQGAVPVMGLVGTWVYLAAIMLGPMLVGLVGARRPGR